MAVMAIIGTKRSLSCIITSVGRALHPEDLVKVFDPRKAQGFWGVGTIETRRGETDGSPLHRSVSSVKFNGE